MKAPEANEPKMKLGRLISSNSNEDSSTLVSSLSAGVKFVSCVELDDDDDDGSDDDDSVDNSDVIGVGVEVNDEATVVVVVIVIVVGCNFSRHS